MLNSTAVNTSLINFKTNYKMNTYKMTKIQATKTSINGISIGMK